MTCGLRFPAAWLHETESVFHPYFLDAGLAANGRDSTPNRTRFLSSQLLSVPVDYALRIVFICEINDCRHADCVARQE